MTRPSGSPRPRSAAYHRYHGVNTHLVRIFNTYGPRLNPSDGRVISNLMMQALRGGPLTIYGDGSQTRSFCYVSDLIDGIVRLAKSAEHDPVNIGNPVEFTILECAKEVQALVGSQCEIEFCRCPRMTRRGADRTSRRRRSFWDGSRKLRCMRGWRCRWNI